MRIQVVCLLLLLAASAVLLDENLGRPSAYNKFRKQHINEQMKAGDCDSVIRNNKIYAMENRKRICKPVNTFILANESRVKSVCSSGEPQGKYTKSREFFNLLACKLTNKKTEYPKCRYKGVKLQNKKIIITCKNKLPVHYQGDIKYCDA